MADCRHKCGPAGHSVLQAATADHMGSSAVVPGGVLRFRSDVLDVFIAVFYSGLGCALALAGVLFWISFISLLIYPASP